MEKFGDRLKEFRLSTGLSVTDFGDRCGVKKSAQTNYESSKRLPDTAYWQLASEMGADIGYIITGKSEFSKISKERLYYSLEEMLTVAMQLEWVGFAEEVELEHLFNLLWGKYNNVSLADLVEQKHVEQLENLASQSNSFVVSDASD